ncbi:MAG: PH domain-containing protein [Bacteroidota bacterium]
MIHEPATRIHKNAIKAWRIAGAIWGLFLFGIPCLYLIGYKSPSFSWMIFVAGQGVAVVTYVLVVFLFPTIRWKRWRYEVSEKEIDLKRGIIVVKRTLVPMNRVQHVDTSHGPIYRQFGLSSIRISTAATTHEIPALDDETAGQLRDQIALLVRQVKDDV